MKTVVIKAAAWGMGGASVINFDPVTGKQYATKTKITADDIQRFKNSMPAFRDKFYATIKPMLAKGGWLFDPTLWKWTYTQPDAYTYTMWVTITFVDDSDPTKAEFMKYIQQTGIMQYDFEIIKPYG